MRLTVTTERVDGILHVRLEGRIDGTTVDRFEAVVRVAQRDGDRALIIDMAELGYMGSAGLRVLLVLAKGQAARGAGLALCAVNDRVRAVLATVGFERIAPIHPSRADAVASLDA